MPTFDEIKMALNTCMAAEPAIDFVLSNDSSQLGTVFAEMMYFKQSERPLDTLSQKQITAQGIGRCRRPVNANFKLLAFPHWRRHFIAKQVHAGRWAHWALYEYQRSKLQVVILDPVGRKFVPALREVAVRSCGDLLHAIPNVKLIPADVRTPISENLLQASRQCIIMSLIHLIPLIVLPGPSRPFLVSPRNNTYRII